MTSRASTSPALPLRCPRCERPAERLEPVMGERDVPVRVCADCVRTLATDYWRRHARWAPELAQW
jgi:hypothetical protein